MAYSCKECGADLNLNSAHLFPPDFYFEAGNKGTLSFSHMDQSKVRLEKEDKIKPFFETINYWGIQRKRTQIKCNSCGHLLGYIYDDGPPLTNSPGQFHLGPSQVIPRAPRVSIFRSRRFFKASLIHCRAHHISNLNHQSDDPTCSEPCA